MTAAPFRVNLPEGSVTFSFSAEAARDLRAALVQLVERLKAVAAKPAGSGSRPDPQPSMEYQRAGEVFVEVFCNPNIWATPFAAKVLLTVRDDRVRLSAETDLSRLLEDLDRYLEQVA